MHSAAALRCALSTPAHAGAAAAARRLRTPLPPSCLLRRRLLGCPWAATVKGKDDDGCDDKEDAAANKVWARDLGQLLYVARYATVFAVGGEADTKGSVFSLGAAGRATLTCARRRRGTTRPCAMRSS